MAQEAMDLCLRVQKESNKSKFDSYSVRNSVLIITHITVRFCRVHIFCDNLSRKSCIFICWMALSNVLTTMVWLANLRLTVHSFYHLFSPPVLRFTGI